MHCFSTENNICLSVKVESLIPKANNLFSQRECNTAISGLNFIAQICAAYITAVLHTFGEMYFS